MGSDRGWAAELNEDNPDPRVACVVLADVSESMKGEPLTALEQGFAAFVKALQEDSLASKRVEVAVVIFGSAATVVVPMCEARSLKPVPFQARGTTNIAAGINLALDVIDDRKGAYKSAGIQYYRPWILILTDGRPNLEGFDAAVGRLNGCEVARGVTVFAVGVGARVDFEQLARLSLQRDPAPLDGLKFTELFEWLSASLSNVSHSKDFVGDDAALEAMGAGVQLPPISGWSTA